MSALTFPTIAEQVLAEFHQGAKFPFAKLARLRGAEVERKWSDSGIIVTTYYFDDDTSITTTGRGKSWRAETHLP